MKKNRKKMTIRKHLCIALISLFFLVGTSSAQAQGGKGYYNTDWPGVQPGLNLTQDQSKRFNDLQSENLKGIGPVSQTITQKQLEIDSIFLDASPDPSRLAELQKEISKLQAQLDEKRLSYQLNARKILTAEQLTLVPSGCSFGFNAMRYDSAAGYGYGCNKGSGRGHGRGHRRGCRW
jgi:Spy/CpxP family protein refolding chaperone